MRPLYIHLNKIVTLLEYSYSVIICCQCGLCGSLLKTKREWLPSIFLFLFLFKNEKIKLCFFWGRYSRPCKNTLEQSSDRQRQLWCQVGHKKLERSPFPECTTNLSGKGIKKNSWPSCSVAPIHKHLSSGRLIHT